MAKVTKTTTATAQVQAFRFLGVDANGLKNFKDLKKSLGLNNFRANVISTEDISAMVQLKDFWSENSCWYIKEDISHFKTIELEKYTKDSVHDRATSKTTFKKEVVGKTGYIAYPEGKIPTQEEVDGYGQAAIYYLPTIPAIRESLLAFNAIKSKLLVEKYTSEDASLIARLVVIDYPTRIQAMGENLNDKPVEKTIEEQAISIVSIVDQWKKKQTTTKK